MKTIYNFLFVLLIASPVFAQNPNVNKAKSALEKGEYAEAKEYIDAAIVHEKTRDKGKTWSQKGQVYDAIAISEDESVVALVGDRKAAIEEAIAAYEKTIEIEGETSGYGFVASQAIDALWGNLLNKGATYFESKDQENALKYFELTQLAKPKDSVAYLYAGIAAQQIEKWDAAERNYAKLAELGAASEDVYSSLIYIARAINEDNEQAIEYIDKAKAAYPANQNFPKEEIAVLLAMDRLEEAQSKLESSIEKEPNNANLRLNLAILYDNAYKALGDKEETTEEELDELYGKAEQAYLSTLEVDSENLVANFNLAVFYNEKANQYFQEVNSMDIKEYQKNGQKLIDTGNEYIKTALPYMEKANTIKPDDIDTLSALQVFYNRLKMTDKALEVQDKIEALEAEG
ncbi:MAG: hypothetical protein AAF363_22360 [Bacteroidota bacterium]